jgi:hypothetical protein
MDFTPFFYSFSFLEFKGPFFIYSIGCGLNFISLELLGSIFIDKVSISGPHYFEDLVDMMYDTISDSFNADFEDNSVEEVIYFPVHSFPVKTLAAHCITVL